MRPLRRWLAGALLALLAQPLAAQDELRKPRPLFADHAILSVTLEAPVDRLIRARRQEGLRVPGRLVVAGDTPESLPVEVALRGLTRRKAEICQFPPLEIRFAQRPPAGSLFAGQRRMKLATHCRNALGFQQHLLLEYAAYRIFSQLTLQSFSARLVAIDYVGADGRPILSRHGILLEHLDQVARRNRMQAVRHRGNLAEQRFDPAAAARFALFQELIGNLDWSMNGAAPGRPCCHNARQLVGEGGQELLVPVPYDFDYSGLVDAPYAVPPQQVRVNSVRDRRYRGFCRHNAAALVEAATLAGERETILAVLDDIEPLDPKARARARAYLDGYLQSLADREQTERRISQHCLR